MSAALGAAQAELLFRCLVPFLGGQETTLQGSCSGVTTALSVVTTGWPVYTGDVLAVGPAAGLDGTTDIFVASANVLGGVTSIPVTSHTPGATHAIGSIVVNLTRDRPPTTLYFALSTTATSEVSVFGVTYSANGASWSGSYAPGVNTLVGYNAYASFGRCIGQVASNTATSITLTGNWNVQPQAGEGMMMCSYTEPATANSYARVAMTNGQAFWTQSRSTNGSSAQNATAANVSAINYPLDAVASWGTIVEMFITDSPTRGQGRLLATIATAPTFAAIAPGQAFSILPNGFWVGVGY